MSMSHKAYSLDYHLFDPQFHQKLIEFMKTNINAIEDPDEGLPFERSWQTTMEIDDIQDYADIALTKFYNPAEDISLNYEWLRVVKIVNEELSLDGDRFVFEQQICSY